MEEAKRKFEGELAIMGDFWVSFILSGKASGSCCVVDIEPRSWSRLSRRLETGIPGLGLGFGLESLSLGHAETGSLSVSANECHFPEQEATTQNKTQLCKLYILSVCTVARRGQ